MKTSLSIILMLLAGLAFAQKSDTTIILITDMQIQIESSQGLNDMYNFKFREAHSQFMWLRNKYSWHPLPFLLLGMNEWWKIQPNPANTAHDEVFLAYMDTVIMVSERLYERPEYKIEAAFFLSAAYGFKGRLYSDEDRKNWRKATVAGKEALNYLEVSKGKPDLSPELLFGDALYNYFSEWIPENYAILKPVMLLFPPGNKELGMKQLKEVSFNAFYTRTEAMVWLMRILHNYENDPKGALYIGEYLYNTYPDNAYFHRYYARLLYSSGRFSDAMTTSERIIQRIDSAHTGYEATSGRYAAFFLGHINQVRRNYGDAKKYYLRAIDFARQIGATETGYYLYSMLNLGRICQEEGDEKMAREYYKMVRSESSRGHSANKEARERMRDL
ncbi:MAG: tetratricopeptide repeat protein [Cyclobacteriaceae bacterium]|nr:tetratricopeptide repeat protein [Cyclobacteriaceae bacterium]